MQVIYFDIRSERKWVLKKKKKIWLDYYSVKPWYIKTQVMWRKWKIYPFECRVPKNSKADKKAFLSDHCKEIEENNRTGKTRDRFKKIRYTKKTFHAKMGSIKDKNGMELRETEDIKKRRQDYTELYKKRSSWPK